MGRRDDDEPDYEAMMEEKLDDFDGSKADELADREENARSRQWE